MKSSKLIEFDNLYAKSFKNACFIGIDEVGRGALAGPVIACAFSWKKNINFSKVHRGLIFNKLNDSKQLSKVERGELYPVLLKYGDLSLGYASVLEIEKLNILNATFLAMKRAFDGLISILEEKMETYVLIDGNKFNPFINSRQASIIDGDAKSAIIASASIIAKVYRDSLMNKISKLKNHKKYAWSENVGYGTPKHCSAVKKYGVTPFHRKLFVRKILDARKIVFS